MRGIMNRKSGNGLENLDKELWWEAVDQGTLVRVTEREDGLGGGLVVLRSPQQFNGHNCYERFRRGLDPSLETCVKVLDLLSKSLMKDSYRIVSEQTSG
jgi:hypothetical protein